jgi:exportin-1
MEQILDFNPNKPYNVAMLDKVVSTMYSGNPQEIQQAQKALTLFQQNPNSWTVVRTILEQSNSPQTKYIALQVLENVVQYKWKILPATDREGMKNFIILTMINSCKDEKQMQESRIFINKLNEVLVQIVKQEWPHNWRNFIPEIVNSSKSSETLCRNNMKILKLLSEEVFDFSGGKMTQDKIEELKTSFRNEFSLIYQLCEFILERAGSSSLIIATLQTLQSFLHWIPHQYIFETKMLEWLITKYFTITQFRNETLRCLTEIASINASQYNNHFILIFRSVIERIQAILPPETNIPEAYVKGSEYDQQFINILGLFLTSFLRNHLPIVETDQDKAYVLRAHFYLVAITKVDDKELFKVCLEYWNYLTEDLFFNQQSVKESNANMNYSLMLSQPTFQRKMIYTEVLSQLRVVLISKMAKPEEVIIVEDENGQVIKEYMKDVDSIALYKTMKETLIYLTHLDPADTEAIMTHKLKEVQGPQWSRNNLNTLCWAIGSISGAMGVKEEKQFLIAVIKDLLTLCENKRSKDDKAVVASNIMYVVGQYPRFLIDHWKFLKTVVNKLFEFMHESFPGVQEMACETFLKISKKCRTKFVKVQMGETRPFIEEILETLESIICDLEPAHVQIFFEAVGFMIQSAEPKREYQEQLLAKLMELPNARWQAIMHQAGRDVSILTNTDVMKDLINLLKTNVATAKSVGAGFISHLSRIFREILEVYKAYSRIISEEIARVGPQVAYHSHVKSMRAIKREVLKLVETFIVNTNNPKVVAEHFVPVLLDATLSDYKMNVPDARDPGVLSLLAVTINKMQSSMIRDLPKILENVLECTLPMITKNFEDYPEHRINLFNLLRAINKHCFQAFFDIPPAGFKLVIDSVLWASKHHHNSIYETGLNILLEMLKNVDMLNNPQILNNFHQSYFLSILNAVFYVLTDSLHKSAFDIEVSILFQMFNLIQSGKITVPIYDIKNMNQSQLPSNQDFIKQHLATVLPKNFQNLTQQQVYNFVTSLFVAANNEEQFKGQLRDFLVQMKEYNEYFLQEALERKKKQQEQAKRQNVPGLTEQVIPQDM